MKQYITKIPLGVMMVIAVTIATQAFAAKSESANMQGLSEAKPLLLQESPPVVERAMWMMFQSGGEPTWALVMGGMMLGGAAIMASSSLNDDDGHGTRFMPVMMGVMGTGMLIYYFVADDEPRTTQPVGGDRYQAWHPYQLDIQRESVRATATWRW